MTNQKDHVIGNKLEDLSEIAENNKMTIGQFLMRAVKGELTDAQVAQLDEAKSIKREKPRK